ncbi:unnamed protein product [Rotaria sordida]|uniref:DDE-1 domain-containing protein n=1 Tax=Rotaria sordida TaxID=392033 RepID=A0A815KNR6_9BILA|nr:unnamed protein product [Rotaria sordida]CAF1395575.1 unnamed protein product [Rotaria sordida]
MANEYEKYISTFKQKVLEEYRPGIYGSGFKSLAKHFKIKGGHHLIMCWYRQWDGTVQSLNAKPRTGRPRTLTNEEVERYVLNFVETMNNQHKPVDYKMVQNHVEVSLNRKVAIATIKRYGRTECGITSRTTHEITTRDIDENHWIEIGKFRKFLQRISNDRLIFIDEIAIYGIMPPLRTLVAPGHQSFVIVDKPSAYAERFDFIGAINGSKPIACMTLTPVDRKAKDIQGVRKEVIHEWIIKSLAPAINRLNIDRVHLICDRSRAHNRAEMMQAFIMGKCKSVINVHYMPTASAKYISPLDNPIWHSFRETVRKQHPLTISNLPSILSRTFYSLSRDQIMNAYRKCAITYGTDVFYDQPFT